MEALLNTIDRDARHRGVLKLLNYATQQRQLADWPIGLTNLDDRPHGGQAGYSDILNEPLDSGWFRDDPTLAQLLLMSFRRYR